MSDMIIVTLVTGVLGAVGGVGLWTFLAKWLELGVGRETAEITRLRSDVDTAKREAIEAKASHKACENRVEDLERRLEAVEHHHSSYMARWIKDGGKRIIWINSQALLTIFAPLGYSRNDVVGRTFVELLDPGAAREIDRLDRAALAIPGQAASTMLQLHPNLPTMVVVKVAGAGRDGELIYEGYAYCPNDREEADDRGERRQQEQRGLSQLRLAGPDTGSAGSEPA